MGLVENAPYASKPHARVITQQKNSAYDRNRSNSRPQPGASHEQRCGMSDEIAQAARACEMKDLQEDLTDSEPYDECSGRFANDLFQNSGS
jgi:hypothetical protein